MGINSVQVKETAASRPWLLPLQKEIKKTAKKVMPVDNDGFIAIDDYSGMDLQDVKKALEACGITIEKEEVVHHENGYGDMYVLSTDVAQVVFNEFSSVLTVKSYA